MSYTFFKTGFFMTLCFMGSVIVKSQTIQIDKVVETYSGFGSLGTKNGSILEAEFKYPEGIDISNSGDIYVGDNINAPVVRKINSQNMVSTYAGTGVQGYKDGDVSEAHFSNVYDVLFKEDENTLYLVDEGNHIIRKISPQGIVSTVIGKADEFGYVDGTKEEALFRQPSSLVFDNDGNMYVTDTDNHVVRKVSPEGDVTTLAGTGTPGYVDGLGAQAQFNKPNSITIDSDDNLYVTEYAGHRIRKITLNGEVSTLAGSSERGYEDGLNVNSKFDSPNDIVFHPDGFLLVVDHGNNRIRKISLDGVVSTYAGNGDEIRLDGFATSASFNAPKGITVNSNGDVYLSEYSSIRKIKDFQLEKFSTVEGIPSTYQELSISGSNLLEDVIITAPVGFEVSTNSFSGYNTTLVIPSATHLSIKIYLRISSESSVGNKGGDLIITSNGIPSLTLTLEADVDERQAKPTIGIGYKTSLFAGSGLEGFTDGSNSAAQFSFPAHMAFDNEGNLLVADQFNHSIRKIDKDSNVTTVAGTGVAGDVVGDVSIAQFNGPSSVTVDKEGNIYVADFGNHKIKKIDLNGNVTTVAGSTSGNVDGDVSIAKFYGPSDLLFDSKGNLFIADQYNWKLRKIDKNGVVSTFYENGASMKSLDIDGNDNIYTIESYFERIVKISPDGNSQVIAGGTAGYVNSGGTNSRFDRLTDLAVSSDGTIYLTSHINNGFSRVRKIDPSGAAFLLTCCPTYSGYVEGTSSEARFEDPRGIVVGKNDDIFIADAKNFRIRKVEKFQVPSIFSEQGEESNIIDIPIITSGLIGDIHILVPENLNLKVQSQLSKSSHEDTLIYGSYLTTFSLKASLKTSLSIGSYNDIIRIYTEGSDTLYIPIQSYVDKLVSVDDDESEIFEVYPIPTSGVLQVVGLKSITRYQVVDIMGKIVSEGVINGETLDVSSLNPGNFVLKIEGEIIRFVKY